MAYCFSCNELNFFKKFNKFFQKSYKNKDESIGDFNGRTKK